MVKLISLPTSPAAFLPGAVVAARWTTALLVVALGISFAQLSWLLLPVSATLPTPLVASRESGTGADTLRLETMAVQHLFGTPQATARPESQINAPETALNLTLRGLFAAARKESAFAIIAEGAGNERPYRIGGKLGGGAVVHDILSDRVVLERSGRYETLRLPKDRLEVSPSRGAEGGAALTPAMGGQLRNLRESIKNNPQELLNLAEMQPVVHNGQLRGYRIRPRRYLELFAAAGLSPNDIVTAVNGIPVTDPAQFAALTVQLTSASSLRLSVERPNGVSEDISLDLN